LIGDVDERGEPILGDTLLLLLNAHHEAIPFTLPPTKPEHTWERLADTAEPDAGPALLAGGQQYPLQGRSVVVLRTRLPEEPKPVITTLQADNLRKEVQTARAPL